MKKRNLWLSTTVCIAVLLFGWGTSFAAVITWDGDTSSDWSVGTNWVGDTAPGAGDDAVFPALDYGGTVNQPNVPAGGITCASVSFDSSNQPIVLTLAGLLRIEDAGTVSCLIAGTNGVTITGAGSIRSLGTLTIDNDDSGGLTISCGGILGVDAILFAGAEDIYIWSDIDGFGTPVSISMDASDDAVTFDGGTSHSGDTTVNPGTLNYNGIQFERSDIIVSGAGSILAGTGTIDGNITLNAGTILAPGANNGDATGMIGVAGSIVFNGNSMYRVTVTGGATDIISCGGDITATGNVPTVEIQAGWSTSGLFIPATIISLNPFPTYTAFDESNLPAGWDIDDAKVGNLVRIIAIPAPPAAVPTLNEWGLIIASLLLLITAFKFMRKQKSGETVGC